MKNSISIAIVAIFAMTSLVAAQVNYQSPTFQQLPGYKNYEKVSKAVEKINRIGRVKDVAWSVDGSVVTFKTRGQQKYFEIAKGKIVDGAYRGKTVSPKNFSPRGKWDKKVGRALQADKETSPDKKWIATYKKYNITLRPAKGNSAKPIVVTSQGTERIRYGTACWVYGEELYQSRAMWWSPDSKKLVFYRIDETHMRDYHLTLNNAANPLDEKSDLYTKLLSVRYPTAGQPNPKVSLQVYDLDSGKTSRIKIKGPADQYLFNIHFAPDGRLLMHRTNRRQNVLDVLAVDMKNLSYKTIVTERQSTWQNNLPMMYFLEDNRRFVWETERTLWKHYELRDDDGNFINKITNHGNWPVFQILRLDEKAGFVYFTAFSDPVNPLNMHLHRVKLDGTAHKRLTSKMLNHTAFHISPNGKHFVTTFEGIDTPPATAIYDEHGNEIAVLAEKSDGKAKTINLTPSELFRFTADDGKTQIYGVLHKPSNFDENKKYPLIIDVYGGPQSNGPANVYAGKNKEYCEFGYLIAKIGNRGTANRGKAFESANYLNLGGVDIRDQAEGVRYLKKRKYVDGNRIGIFGHSYGGYMSAMAVLKYPDLFHVAVSGAPVTDWKNYDTIYTERYMQTPKENKAGYSDGSCLKYVKNLKGKLLLVHGLIDDNVHPSNTWQLVQALHDANKRFDLQVFPNNTHRIKDPYNAIRWEYFHKHLSSPGDGHSHDHDHGIDE